MRRGKWGAGRSTGRGNCNQDMLCEKKKSIFNKKESKKIKGDKEQTATFRTRTQSGLY